METEPAATVASQIHLSRRMWQTLEPYHAMIYFAPEARAAFADVGLKGYWMGYFASRAAPLGPVPAEVVTATFYNFHPRMVARAIPDAWRFADPARILAVRYAAADAALVRLLGDAAASDNLVEAATLARRAAEA
ncbi:MAG: SCO6745 family protein, partial [Ktedonobacterales bacterium]